MTYTTKKNIVIPWAVKAVTIGKAPPFPYATEHKSGLDVHIGQSLMQELEISPRSEPYLYFKYPLLFNTVCRGDCEAS